MPNSRSRAIEIIAQVAYRAAGDSPRNTAIAIVDALLASPDILHGLDELQRSKREGVDMTNKPAGIEDGTCVTCQQPIEDGEDWSETALGLIHRSCPEVDLTQ